ncbi:deoxyribonuclease IV [Chengkuizengella axinellae]|uniref:Deoxyribonuclease IV n=1 Tax=Chengkuizengella axinellae TaxID=3064388 RepID=A0ABT9IXJ7_9BACL|nr:deoxyribonuclease IV [Chengkuizengella sp. 2205SS18-9]MDP5274086.1 deoxyribonuclease IV [Chengkuizengella sp. 2205SS18-9]
MYLGCHISIRKGFLNAAKTAQKIGASAFQYFPKNPRSLKLKQVDQLDAQACAEFCEAKDMLSIAHTPYPTNLAVEDQLRNQMAASILNDLEIANSCGSLGLVVHFGKFSGKDPLQGYKNILQCLNGVLSKWHGKTLILLENQAGMGTKMGMTFEELIQIRNLAQYPEKIGFCFDTCHAYASGLWNETNWEELYRHGEKLGFFKHVKAVHLNDSKYSSGSYRDRHENIGYGMIGEHRFELFLKSGWLKAIPIILETPTSQHRSYEQELKYINRLIHKGDRK